MTAKMIWFKSFLMGLGNDYYYEKAGINLITWIYPDFSFMNDAYLHPQT